MVRLAGLTLLALLLMAPGAGASTCRHERRHRGVLGRRVGRPRAADALRRHANRVSWYVVTDDGGITPQSPCVRVSSTMAGCRLTSGLGYQLNTGDGADTVTIAAGVPTGTTDLGPGDDTFTGQSAADIVHGGDGNDTLRGAGGNDQLFGDGGNDLVAGQTGNDARRRRRGRRPARVRRRGHARRRRASAPTTSTAARARTASATSTTAPPSASRSTTSPATAPAARTTTPTATSRRSSAPPSTTC